MPCYEVRLMSVEFKAKSYENLMDALKKIFREKDLLEFNKFNDIKKMIYLNANRTEFIDLRNGKITMEYPAMINEIKREYSKVVVKKLAKKMKWLYKEKSDLQIRLKRI